MFIRLIITLVLGFSCFASMAQYEVTGTVTNTRQDKEIIPNHPVYFFVDSVLIDKVNTNLQGSYSYFFEENLNGALIIKTVGFCDSWIIYTDTLGRSSKDVTIINFEICHQDTSASCISSFEYEHVDSVTLNFKPNHNLENLMDYDWDFGDNQNGSNDYNPQYQYADQNVYVVQLITTNPFGCVDTSISEVLASDNTLVRGQLSIPNNFFANAFIHLIGIEDNLIKETVYPNEQGFYQIWCEPDDYIIKIVPDLDIDDYFPRVLSTYLGGTIDWLEAEVITDEHEIKDVNIEALTSVFIPNSFNKISVKLEADFNLNQLPIGVYLLDENFEPIDFGKEVAQDRFEFDGLPRGTYYVFPECPGRNSNPYQVVFEYTGEAPVFLEFIVQDTEIKPVGINDLVRNDDRFNLYPIPVKNLLNIKAEYPVSKIQITDASGRLFSSQQFGMEKNCSLSTHNWPQGIYFVTVFFDGQPPGCQKIIK